MIFATTFVLASALVASAANINVIVGDQNGLLFNPTSVTANPNDTVSFQFMSKNHTVTQSSFTNPCTHLPGGVNSGFQAVTPGSSTIPSWSITINDAQKPLWFYCAQKNPVNHCEMGMVFAINAPADKPFSAFQAAAKNSGNGTTTPSAGAGSPSGGVVPGATAGAGLSSGGANSGASATDSSAPSGSTSAPNGAIASRNLSSAGAVSFVSLIAAVAGFML